MTQTEEQIDQLLKIAIETKSDVKELKEKMARFEEVHEKVYNKLDGFLVLIQRHESEIAALNSAYKRLDERLEKLEAQAV